MGRNDLIIVQSHFSTFFFYIIFFVTGNASDSLMDNNQNMNGSRAHRLKGAWWYNACHYSNFNCPNRRGFDIESKYASMNWYYWKRWYYSFL